MEQLKSMIAQISADQAWIVQVFIIVFLALLANVVALYLFNRLEKQLQKTSNPWDDALLFAARKPASIGIWVVGIGWAADIARDVSNAVIFDAVDPLRDVLIILLLAWFLVRFVSATERNWLDSSSSKQDDSKQNTGGEEAALDAPTVRAMAKLMRLAVIITTALVVLQALGFSISGVLAFGGVGGIAVGFAAKDLLANFFGGLMIYLDKPFVIGDWIRSPDKEVEGTVEYIGWRLSRIRTFDKRPLYVPNATFAQIAIENPSRMTNRRIYETIGVRYQDSAAVEKITSDVETMLREHDEIDADQTLMVNFNKFAESSLDFFIYCFTRTTNWQHFHVVKQDVLLKVLAIIDAHDAAVAFPTRVVDLHSPPEAQAEVVDAQQ